MRRSFGLATTVAITISTLLVVLIPGAAKAAPSNTTIYPLICTSTDWIYVYLDYGVNAVTITNPNACSGAQSLFLVDGRESTWTYSQTISGTTTSGSYDPTAITNFETGAIGTSDSFTLTLTSATSNYITMSGGIINLKIYFNTQFNTLTPDPVAIGQQGTLTGSNLSSVTALGFRDGSKFFSAPTTNVTATQLTFTVPLTFTYRGVTSNVMPGTYSFTLAMDKTLTVIAAPIVIPTSNEEVARLAAAAASVVREAEKRSARDVVLRDFKSFTDTKLEIFGDAEIKGITSENIAAVHAEITALPEHSTGDITGILKIARKFEVVDIIASERVTCIYSNNLIEIGLIPMESKYKATLTNVVKNLPLAERSSYKEIQEVLALEMTIIQAREDRLTKILALIASRRNG